MAAFCVLLLSVVPALVYDFLVTERVLLLNASYEAICTVTLKRAVVLVLTEKAEMIAARDRQVRSPSTAIPMPSVIRLVRYVSVPRFRKAYLSRKAILQRDRYECCYCGGVASTMDHVIPRSRGGMHTWTNVVACCYDCNQEKDSFTPEELGWRMRFKGVEPSGSRRVALIVGGYDPDWEEWLISA